MLSFLILAQAAVATPCPPSTDSVRATAYAVVAPASAAAPVPPALLASVLTALADSIPRPAAVPQAVVLPGVVVTALRSSLPSSEPIPNPARGPRLLLRAAVRLIIRRPGVLTDALETTPDATPYAHLLHETFARMARDSMFIPLPADFKADSAVVDLRVQLQPDSSADSRAVFELIEPSIATRNARTKSRQRPPYFPDIGRQVGGWADLAADFVVDTSGKVDLGSLDFSTIALPDTEESYAAAFARSIRDVLQSMRFYPALLGTCAVQQRVYMPFSFRSSRE